MDFNQIYRCVIFFHDIFFINTAEVINTGNKIKDLTYVSRKGNFHYVDANFKIALLLNILNSRRFIIIINGGKHR